ncbi:MAG: TraR/DksA C4-type zinc finger protein [Thermodesulfobacteriota bacterium]
MTAATGNKPSRPRVHHAKCPKKHPARSGCLKWGEPIPEARRQAQPGCEDCVQCQNWLEKGHGFWP